MRSLRLFCCPIWSMPIYGRSVTPIHSVPSQHPPCSLYCQAILSCFIQKWVSHGPCGREGRLETWDGQRTNTGWAIQAIRGRMCLHHREEARRTVMRESWWWYLDTQLTKGKLMSKRIIPISITSWCFQRLPMMFAHPTLVMRRLGHANNSKTVPTALLISTVPSRWHSCMWFKFTV